LEQLPLPVLVLLVVAAVIAGLWVGARAGDRLEASKDERKKGKSLGARARDAATSGVVRLWKWNRARKKKQDA
jgi:hypothetical protein